MLVPRPFRSLLVAALAISLSACGGGGGSSTGTSITAANPVATVPTATTPATCSLLDRQNWAAAQIRENYLFPETLPASLDPAPYTTVDAYIDALTATARTQRRDRFFTFLTSITADNAFFAAGNSAGFGIRLATDATARTVSITEAFEGTPALAAGIDRGATIIGVGDTPTTVRLVSDIIAADGIAGVTTALGPSTAGVTRTLRIRDAGGTRDITLAKADYNLLPISTRYGSRIIDDGGRRVAYLNLRTFISSAETPLRTAFDQYRAAGIADFVIDLRYNGGGLVSTAELLANLLGGNRARSDVIDYVIYRAEKSSNNSTATFSSQSQSASPLRIAFIGTAATASASELVINAFVPYLHASVALVGTNTFGKPVGQIAVDRVACDDRLRVVAFATQNAARNGNYYDGLAATMEASCQAADDIARPLGDAQEASTRAALDFLAGRGCTRISGAATTASASEGNRVLLTPDRPTAAQRDVPGLF